MMNTLCKTILLSLAIISSAQGQHQSTNDLAENMRHYLDAVDGVADAKYNKAAEFRAYVLGVFDATMDDYTLPKNIEVQQVMAVVVKYIKDNPKIWSKPAASTIKKALSEAFPK